ncbi:hypothetical protein Slin15195_G078660 [Septoria linicola]|uniref:Xylanolytic transcriptional activator regulatory domain-containing protein n=1 Tax=Septoria linicola TaxID=215465 RepID=A0A9Q9ARR1_9PEZI|nr:hypothetical protein Slin14017_G039860 [Septoria linicola]USW54547.1 hypothetical protein Slin15195_G078660 [Septoria linicola]
MAGTSEEESGSLMLNPPMAEDVKILKHYLSSQSAIGAPVAKPYSVVSNTPGAPIVYLRLTRKRPGLQVGQTPGLKQREIMEQVLGRVRDDVVDLFFAKLHPCFPIIDEKTFRDLWQKDRARISSTLICNIYAAALHFWQTSERLTHQAQPDLTFMWNQAVSALHEDFLGATMSTTHASLLDLIGRPVLSIAGNVVTLERTVSLAHSLGLHRDPMGWHTTKHEKEIRVRL